MKQQLMLAERVRTTLAAIASSNKHQLEEALKPYNISSSQAEVIGLLGERGPLSLKQIGQLITCEKASPSRLIKRMQSAGFVSVVKDESDRRTSRVLLTAHGRHLARVIERVYFTININTSKRLTTNEQLQLEILLSKLA